MRTSDVKTAAAALVLGGTLEQVTDDGHRLTFHFDNVPDDLPVQILTKDVRVGLAQYITALEQIHGLVAQYRRARP